MSEENSEIIYEGIPADRDLFLIGMCEYRGYIYGVSVTDSVILRMDIKDGSIHYVAKIPEIKWNSRQSYHYLRVENDVMYLIPFREKSLVTYNMISKEFNVFPLALDDKFQGKNQMYFYNFCRYGSILYLLPFCYRAIVAYDLSTGEIRYCVELDNTDLKDDDVLFQPYEWIDENEIMLTSFSSNSLAFFNLKTEEFYVKKVGDNTYRFTIAKKVGDDVWIFVKNKMAVLKWDYRNDDLKEFKLPEGCKIANDRHTFDGMGVIEYDGKLFAFPASANMAIKLNLEIERIDEIIPLQEYCNNRELNREISTFDGAVKINNKMFLQYQLGKILEFNLDTEEVKVYERKINNTFDENKKMQKEAWEYFWKQLEAF